MTGTPYAIGGRYTLVRKLGEGGMAEVWLAEDQRLNGRYVAVKRLLGFRADATGAPDQIERARREAYSVSGLHHPNLVAVTDFLVEQGEPVIVMEYVDGRTLHELRGMPAPRAAWLGSQVASALAAAHALGIVHRDVKPANILVTAQGDAKLADFGIARAVDDPRLTATGMFTGTIRYLAPEVLNGVEATAASDIWSLGATLYEVLEARPAFDAPTSAALIGAIALGDIPRVTSAPELAGVVDRMLRRDPRERPVAAQVAAELRALAGAPAGTPAAAPPPGAPVAAVPPWMPTHVAGGMAGGVPAGAPAVAPAGAPGAAATYRPPPKKRSRGWILVAAPVAVVVAGVAIAVAVTRGGNGDHPLAGSGQSRPPASASAPNGAGGAPAPGTTPLPSASSLTPSTAPTSGPPATSTPTTGADGSVRFEGVTVRNPRTLTSAPVVTSASTTDPAALRTLDLVTGTGAPASPTSTVSVQYVGVLYRNGVQFDSSWTRGSAASFSLQQVIPGFAQGIGGTTGLAPMRVGGRRVLIIPATLGYGAQPQEDIPANSPLVFVVDLKAVT